MVVRIELFPPEQSAQADFETGQLKYYTTGDNALVWMREIGKNVVTPAYVLQRLAASLNAELRMAVADHINTPMEVLFLLAEDENPDVRFAIAENHNISRDVLNKLTDDSNPHIASRAEKTLSRVRTNDGLHFSWRPCRAA